MKTIFIDLSGSPLLGTAAKSVWLIQGYLNLGYHVKVINKNWSEDIPVSGVTYNSADGEYEAGSWTQLWDPSSHPNDFFENLVIPSFENVSFSSRQVTDFFSKTLRALRSLLDPRYISNHDFVTMSMSARERNDYRSQKLADIWNEKSVKSVLAICYFCIQFYITRRLKIVAEPSPFRYKLAPHLHTPEVEDYIDEAKSSKQKYILISVLWDENKKIERRNFLKGGPRFNPSVFDALLKYVADLDEEALSGRQIKFLLVSKKAVDWEAYLKSEFLDLRNFEASGFCLSQSLYIAQELAVATINWPSTYSIWITNCAEITHLTWMDERDTSPWARNTIHHRPVAELLSRVGAL